MIPDPGTPFLVVIADDAPETPKAVLFAALRAKATGAQLLLLSAVEPPEGVHWPSVAEDIRLMAQRDAREAVQPLLDLARQTLGHDPHYELREGHLRDVIRQLQAEDMLIRELVLAAAPSGNPGPLVLSLAKGERFGARGVPVLVVPGSLSDSEIHELAG